MQLKLKNITLIITFIVIIFGLISWAGFAATAYYWIPNRTLNITLFPFSYLFAGGFSAKQTCKPRRNLHRCANFFSKTSKKRTKKTAAPHWRSGIWYSWQHLQRKMLLGSLSHSGRFYQYLKSSRRGRGASNTAVRGIDFHPLRCLHQPICE